jgi:hypothetical protein
MPAVPAATPRVLPMRNAAPGQVEQVSQTVARAGAQAQQLGNTIGDRVQDTFDDASARNAETSFLSSSNDVLTRYTHTLGKDAIDGYDGATQEIVTAKQTARDSLTNPVQQHLFDAMAVPRLVEFGKTLSDHHFQQNIQYGTQAANDRSDSLVQLSANGYADWQRPDGKYTTNKLMAVHEAQQAALLLGQPPDSPQAKALVRTKTTALAQGVLTRMMDNEQYSEAQHYYDQAMANGEIDERSAEMLGNAVMEGHNAQKGALLMSDARQAALGAQAAAPRPSGAMTPHTSNGCRQTICTKILITTPMVRSRPAFSLLTMGTWAISISSRLIRPSRRRASMRISQARLLPASGWRVPTRSGLSKPLRRTCAMPAE